MNISQVLHENRIVIDIKATSKEEVIKELVAVAATGIDMDIPQTLSAFMERENLGSTGIGLGVAVPHIRIESIDQCLVVFGKSNAGIDYAAIDNKPVHLFFMIFGPLREERQENYLKLMASISKMLRNADVRAELIGCNDASQAVSFFASQP